MAEVPFDSQGFYRDIDRAYAQGAPSAVADALRRGIEAARLSGDPLALVIVASELGSVLRARGELAAAERLYLAALPAADAAAVRSPLSRCNVRINLGDVYLAQGRARHAVTVFDEAELLLGDAASHPYEASAICNNRASAYRLLHMFPEARRDLDRASELLADAPGMEGERAVQMVARAQVLIEEGDLDAAEASLEPALSLYERLSGGRDIHRPQALSTAATVALLRGDPIRALDFLEAAIAVAADKLGSAPVVRQLEEKKRRVERAMGKGAWR